MQKNNCAGKKNSHRTKWICLTEYCTQCCLFFAAPPRARASAAAPRRCIDGHSPAWSHPARAPSQVHAVVVRRVPTPHAGRARGARLQSALVLEPVPVVPVPGRSLSADLTRSRQNGRDRSRSDLRAACWVPQPAPVSPETNRELWAGHSVARRSAGRGRERRTCAGGGAAATRRPPPPRAGWRRPRGAAPSRGAARLLSCRPHIRMVVTQ